MKNFQELILCLEQFWSSRGCLLIQPYDVEVGAGTFHPATFLRVLGPEPWHIAYVEPSRRPQDGRYGQNPNRLQLYHQYQVIMKPSPDNIQNLYLDSLTALGFDLAQHDLRFVEDDWESPTLGAWGLGWEVWMDGMEITQFTYFQQAGGLDLDPISVEITYGIERICMFLQEKDNVYEIEWGGRTSGSGSTTGKNGIAYGEIAKESEYQFSKFNFEEADISWHRELFEKYEKESQRLLSKGLILPAYDYTLKCSHFFNILDARKAFSVAQRVNYIGRVRRLSAACARAWMDLRSQLGFPLLSQVVAPQANKVDTSTPQVEPANLHK